jgi:hypothetical protein
VGEAHAVVVRLVAPGLAALALLGWVAGFAGFAALILLAAIVAGSVRLLAAVGDVAEGHGDRFVVGVAVLALAWLVAAGATHVPLLVLGAFACLGLELLGALTTRPDTAAESVELMEAPVSRAA